MLTDLQKLLLITVSQFMMYTLPTCYNTISSLDLSKNK